MKQTNKLLLNKLEEVKEMDTIELIQDRSRLEEQMEKNIEASQEELPNVNELIEDFMQLFVYNRELKRRADILEQRIKEGR